MSNLSFRGMSLFLKSGGFLSIVPDHMDEGVFLETVQGGNLFSLQARHGEAYHFTKRLNGRPELAS